MSELQLCRNAHPVPQKVIEIQLDCTKSTQNGTKIYKCRSVIFLVVIVFVSAMLVHIVYLSNVENLYPPYMLPKINSSQLNKTVSRKTYLSAVADVDLSIMPPLPTIPTNKSELFKPALSEKEVTMLSEILQRFHHVMVRESVQYFLYKGSLLGSYRHHGLIPWDDDLDVVVNKKDTNKIWRAFKNSTSKFILSDFGGRLKFYHESGKKINKFKWRAPFIDVSFYKDNSTHLWDNLLKGQSAFLKSNIFPLQDRPYLGHLYPAPRDPLSVLRVTYKIDDCYTGNYIHASEMAKNKTQIMTIPCSALIDYVPMVSHVRGPGGAWCQEVLTFKGQVLNTFIRNSTNIPVC